MERGGRVKLGRGGVGGRREMVGENARKTIKEAKRILGKGGGHENHEPEVMFM